MASTAALSNRRSTSPGPFSSGRDTQPSPLRRAARQTSCPGRRRLRGPYRWHNRGWSRKEPSRRLCHGENLCGHHGSANCHQLAPVKSGGRAPRDDHRRSHRWPRCWFVEVFAVEERGIPPPLHGSRATLHGGRGVRAQSSAGSGLRGAGVTGAAGAATQAVR